MAELAATTNRRFEEIDRRLQAIDRRFDRLERDIGDSTGAHVRNAALLERFQGRRSYAAVAGLRHDDRIRYQLRKAR